MKDILIYTTRACPYCIVAKRALDSRHIPYREVDITQTPQVRDELHAKTGERTVPQIFVDGRYIGQDDELVAMVEAGELDPAPTAPGGVSGPDAEEKPGPRWDVAVIGGGHSGLEVARRLGKAGIRVAVLERAPRTTDDDAAPGATGVERVSAEVFGLEAEAGGVTTLVTLDAAPAARAVVIATGARDRAADIPGEADLAGRGVSRCAECDGVFFSGRDVAIAGCDERTARAALHLASICRTTILLCPDERLNIAPETLKQMDAASNIKRVTATRVTRVHGKDEVQAVEVTGPGGIDVLEVAALFVYLTGERPAGDFASGTVTVGANGAIKTDKKDGTTTTPGVFAVGSVTGHKAEKADIDAVVAAVRRYVGG
ncbi:MAG: FAD-dependent oxidoreductase [Nitrospirota bacterium]|nr:FAD-dependent oxidoreductase [Nitrospirota bacterium]